jgi:hypothetical protein
VKTQWNKFSLFCKAARGSAWDLQSPSHFTKGFAEKQK